MLCEWISSAYFFFFCLKQRFGSRKTRFQFAFWNCFLYGNYFDFLTAIVSRMLSVHVCSYNFFKGILASEGLQTVGGPRYDRVPGVFFLGCTRFYSVRVRHATSKAAGRISAQEKKGILACIICLPLLYVF